MRNTKSFTALHLHLHLHLDQQLCFQLYLAAKTMAQLYQPLLVDLDITYPQYLVMLVLWEEKEVSVKELGRRLQLDSGTLSPLIKRLEAKGVTERQRDPRDERSVRVRLTVKGDKLRDKAKCIPLSLLNSLQIPQAAVQDLLASLKDLNGKLEEQKGA